jgi:hypothetical protein
MNASEIEKIILSRLDRIDRSNMRNTYLFSKGHLNNAVTDAANEIVSLNAKDAETAKQRILPDGFYRRRDSDVVVRVIDGQVQVLVDVEGNQVKELISIAVPSLREFYDAYESATVTSEPTSC